MNRRWAITKSLMVLLTIAGVAMCTSAIAAPIFYLSTQPLGTATPGIPDLVDQPANTAGVLNIYVVPDVRVYGVSLDVFHVGNAIKFTGATTNNPVGPNFQQRWAIPEPTMFSDNQVTRIGGGSIPFLLGNGVGPGSPDAADATSGYLIGSINYVTLGEGATSEIFMRIGENTMADQNGSIQVIFGPGSPPSGPNAGSTDNLFDARISTVTPPPQDDIPPAIELVNIHYDLRLDPPPILAQLLATDQPPPPDGTAPEDLVWSGLMYDSGPGKNFLGADDPDMDGDGVFSWNPAGWRQGIHNWKATVTDLADNSTTSVAVSVDLWVPEPATASLVGLALLGMVGLVRRRS